MVYVSLKSMDHPFSRIEGAHVIKIPFCDVIKSIVLHDWHTKLYDTRGPMSTPLPITQPYTKCQYPNISVTRFLRSLETVDGVFAMG